MKIKIITAIFVIAAIALVSGATYLALAYPGTQEDPVITMDYLNTYFKPQIMTEVSKTEQELMQAFDIKIAELEERLKAEQSSAVQVQNSAEKFSLVTLSSGQTMTCSVGAEVMLRIGTATGTGSAPALVNYTDGSTLAAGAALTANNMYLVTIEGNGLKATADTVRVLVRGTYKVG